VGGDEAASGFRYGHGDRQGGLALAANDPTDVGIGYVGRLSELSDNAVAGALHEGLEFCHAVSLAYQTTPLSSSSCLVGPPAMFVCGVNLPHA